MAKKKIKKAYRKKINRTMRKVQFVSFLLVLGIGFIIACLFFLRPTYSESEKRNLTPFPSFSFQALWSGTYFDNIGIWFSDTFPFRETMVDANSRLHALYGFGDRIYGLSDTSVDVIPDADEDVSVPAIDVFSPEEIDETLGEEIHANGVVQNLGVVVMVDDAAYELYSFSKNIADKYAAVINYTAKELNGTAEVYDMIVPTSIDITMPDSERQKVNSSNQADAIRYFNRCMSEQVHSVNVYNALRNHRTEYIYFRTDHHWTALGAFYAYEQLCNAMHMQPHKLSDFREHSFDGFLGSFYTQTNKSAKLQSHPDTIKAYEPKAETKLTYYKKSGTPVEWKVISDVSDWASTSKYSTFIGGDNPYTLITNESAPSQKSCLVIKESFGNAFVPFLVAEYANVHVIDYRYWTGNLIKTVRDKGIDDVLFINNISATRSATLVKDLYAIVY